MKDHGLIQLLCCVRLKITVFNMEPHLYISEINMGAGFVLKPVNILRLALFSLKSSACTTANSHFTATNVKQHNSFTHK